MNRFLQSSHQIVIPNPLVYKVTTIGYGYCQKRPLPPPVSQHHQSLAIVHLQMIKIAAAIVALVAIVIQVAYHLILYSSIRMNWN